MIYAAVPREVERVWGSLRSSEGRAVGEIWQLYHTQRGESSGLRALSPPGCRTETTVADLVSEGLLPRNAMGVFPLLVKTLHTARALSVQVHPGASPGSPGRKDETWFVLGCGEDSWLACGLERGVGPDDLREAIESDGDPMRLMSRKKARRGDILHLPAGCIHALGPGLEVLEIQANYDVTFRLYDWDRLGADGRPRELHTDLGLKALDWRTRAGCLRVGRMGSDRPDLSVCANPSYVLAWLEQGGHTLLAGSVAFVVEGSALADGEEARAGTCLVSDAGGGELMMMGRGVRADPAGNGQG
ncbi:class I mannose-6-phosphate isomerase [Candidatus Fermentibacterales bacterium]|nr:class I mannose-6-phosphate isomerase [Candidatus Fermentibacterales bacterium]